MSLILDGTNGLSDVDGTAAAPALRGTDTNTGIFFPAADTIAFSEGGAEAMRIDSSGNVGIGTTTTTQKLNVYGADANNNVASFTRASGSTLYAYVDTGANVGFFTGSNGAGSGFYANATSNTVQFNTNGAERMRITSAGDLLVGKTSTTGTASIHVAATPAVKNGINIAATTTGTTYAMLFYTSDGVDHGYISYTTSGTSYNTTSDYRLKEAILPMTGALAKVAQLKPVTYKWKADGADGQGFIAHELQAVVPECVTREKDAVQEQQYEVTPAVMDEEGNIVTEAVMGTRTVPAYQGIDTSFLVATLTAAIQEQQALIVSMRNELDALKTKVGA